MYFTCVFIVYSGCNSGEQFLFADITMLHSWVYRVSISEEMIFHDSRCHTHKSHKWLILCSVQQLQ